MKNKSTILCLLLIATQISMSVELAASDDKQEQEKAKPEAVEQEAQSKVDIRVVAFPLEGVNVLPRVLDASNEVLWMSLTEEGYIVADWEIGYKRVTGFDAPPPPKPPAPVPPAPSPSPVLVPIVPYYPVTPQGPTPSVLSGQGVVDHASPPPSPGAQTPQNTIEDQPEQFQQMPGNSQTATAATEQPMIVEQLEPLTWVEPEPEPPPAPKLTAELKNQIAREMGCEAYVDGKLVLLGSKIRVTVKMKNIEGDILDSKQMEAQTEDDLHIIFKRISRALALGMTIEETLDLDNATVAEARQIANRFRLEKNMGLLIGQFFSLDEKMAHYTFIAFDGRFELNDVLIGVNVGLGFTDTEETDSHIFVDILGGYYLSHTSVAPYIALGVGIMLGNFLSIGDSDSDGLESFRQIGFHGFPTFGIEFIRNSRMRAHIDIRYALVVGRDSEIGHGPMITAGLNF